MAKTRIYELARALNMTNQALLDKLAAMGVEVKSHMSSLEEDMVEKVKQELFAGSSGPAATVEQKRVGSNVIRKRKQKTVVKQAEPAEEEAEASEEAVSEPMAAEEAESPAVVAPEVPEEAPEETAAEPVEEAEAGAPETTTAETPEAITEESLEALTETTGIIDEQPEQTEENTLEAENAAQPASLPPKKVKTKKFQPAKIIKFPDAPVKTTVSGRTAATKTRAVPPPAAPAGEGVVPGMDAFPPDSADSDKKASKKAKKKTRRIETEDVEGIEIKKKVASKRKEIVEGAALYDIKPRGRLRKKGKGKVRPAGSGKTQITTPKAIKRRIKIDESISVADMAKRMSVKAAEIIGVLMGMGVMATVNQSIDFETAVLVASEFEYEVEKASLAEEDILKTTTEDDPQMLVPRAPVVTIMGHVDHGKTSLLDVIRQSRITESEAGGITQHIGAYKVKTAKGEVVFLDTPGHEAFTAMRSRGAQATDIVVLVVAADDGVMPQTIEAINHSRAAGVPMVVAINKIDKDGADPDKVKRELAEQGLLSEDWGGDTIFVKVSAKQKIGIDNLLDMILLQSEMLELKANPDKNARGLVLESQMDQGQGPLATVLVQEGTLSVGQIIVCGVHYGKIRAMVDDAGVRVDRVGPSTPVEVFGLNGVADAGDEFVVLDDEKNARVLSESRVRKQREKDLSRDTRVSLENFFDQVRAGDINHLNLIIKADVNGSCEAIEDALKKIHTDEVKINVIHSGAGAIIESDVLLASASNAIILGFNVRPSIKVKAAAAEENVDMRYYNIIYDLIGDIKEAVTGLMASTFEEHTLGRAEVREVFVIPKKGTVAGSFVVDGKIERGRQARLIRDGVVVYEGIVGSLRHYKEDVKEVRSGFECGIGVEQYNDIKVNDVIECYYQEEIKPVID